MHEWRRCFDIDEGSDGLIRKHAEDAARNVDVDSSASALLVLRAATGTVPADPAPASDQPASDQAASDPGETQVLIAAEGVRDIDSSDDALSLFWPFVWPLLTLPALLGAKRSTIVTTACVLDIALVGLSLCWFANVLIWSSELRYGGVLLLLGYVGLLACALIALFWQWRERHSNDAGIVRRSP